MPDDIKASGMQEAAKAVGELTKKFAELGKSIAETTAKVLGLDTSLTEFLKSTIEITSAFEKYEITLEGILGSSQKAHAAFEMIKEAAAKTTFKVKEVDDQFVAFANRGIQLTKNEIISLSDLALVLNKNLGDITTATIKGSLGSFESLNELGIHAKKAGKNIEVSFRGQTVTIQNTDKAIKDYLVSLGEIPGIAGSSEKATQTLGGRLKGLQEHFEEMKLKFGEILEPILDKVMNFLGIIFDKVGSFFTWLKIHSNEIEEIFEPFGAMFKGLKDAIGDAFSPPEGSDWLTIAFDSIGNTLRDLRPLFVEIGAIIGNVLKILLPVWKIIMIVGHYLIKVIAPIVAVIFDGINKFLDGIGTGLNGLFDSVSGLFTGNSKEQEKGFNEILKGYSILNSDPSDKSYVPGAFDEHLFKADKEFIKAKPSDTKKDFTEGDKKDNKKPTATSKKKQFRPNKGNRPIAVQHQGLGSNVSAAASSTPKNINITINKLVGAENINTAEFKQSMSSIKDELIRLMIDTINDTGRLAGSH